ncbi:hypothetical protein [Bacillus sp. AK031]
MNSFQFSLKEVVGIVTVTLSGVLLSVAINVPLFFGFSPGYLVLMGVILKKGADVKGVWRLSWKGVKRTRGVIFILLLVSFILPSWYISGVIDQLISITLHIITPAHFYVLSFLSTLIFSR